MDTGIKIGVALGSGSARGWAHIGVLRALADLGIEPYVVAGTSIGAFVGGAYACRKLDTLEDWARSITWKDILSFFDVSLLNGGIIQGDKLFQFARKQVGDPTIESLPCRLGFVATELDTGREVWYRKGSLLDGVRASVALPGLIAPVKVHGRWLVDGGLINPVPISLCRSMGADVVIAVNLNGDIVGRHGAGGVKRSLFRKKNTPGLFEVMAASINIMQDSITRHRMAEDIPDIIITPRLSQLTLFEFDKADIAIEEGRMSVNRVRSELNKILTT